MFFDIFYDLCQRKGVSCKRAAEEIGLSNSITTKWKKTGATPGGKTLDMIAAYFNVSVDYLLNGRISDEQLSLANGITVFRSTSPEKIDAMLKDLEAGSYRIAYRAPGIAITVSNDASATDAEIDTIVNANRVDPMKTEKAPTETGERSVNDADIKFALFRGREDITDAMYQEVLNFAEYVARREEEKKKKE